MFTAKGGSLRKALYKRHKSETSSGTLSLQKQPVNEPITEHENPTIVETIVQEENLSEMPPVITDTDLSPRKPPPHHRSPRVLAGSNHRPRIKSANYSLPLSDIGDKLTIDVNCVCNADLRSAPLSGPVPGQCKVPGHEKHGHFRSSSASPHIK